MIYWILIIGLGLVSALVSSKLKSKFAFYSKKELRNGLTGAEVARKMLDDHGIRDVQVISTPGMLTDHYNPQKKTVNLSEGVYYQRNAAAAAVAAHECGHAIQHAKGYEWLQMRSRMVPVVNVASGMSTWMIFGGLVLGATTGIGYTIAVVGLGMFALGTLFSFITLPVEYDASNRALAWLKNRNIVSPEEYNGAEDSLKWAARTYVVAAVGSLATLLYFGMSILGGRE